MKATATLKYITSGSVEIGGLVEGDVYSAVYEGGTRFRIDYNTTKQQTVNITSEGTGPHIFRYEQQPGSAIDL